MGVRVYSIGPDDEKPFLEAVQRSRAVLERWVEPPSNSEEFARHLRKYETDNHRCFLGETVEGSLIGCINLNEIVRGAFQSAYLGYYAFEPNNGKGLMKEVLAMVISIAFAKLKLHRLEANIQPENSRSLGLVKSLGFRREGFSPHYLNIGGVWRDHERDALTTEDWVAGRTADQPVNG